MSLEGHSEPDLWNTPLNLFKWLLLLCSSFALLMLIQQQFVIKIQYFTFSLATFTHTACHPRMMAGPDVTSVENRCCGEVCSWSGPQEGGWCLLYALCFSSSWRDSHRPLGSAFGAEPGLRQPLVSHTSRFHVCVCGAEQEQRRADDNDRFLRESRNGG